MDSMTYVLCLFNYLLFIYFMKFVRFWLQRMTPNFISVYNAPRRTNNNIESFHNSLKLKFSVVHPNLWVFIRKLQKKIKNNLLISFS